MKAFDRISVLHLMVGGLQAILAYGLYQSAELSVWPATHAAAYIPLFMVMVFMPLSFYCASDAMAVKRWLLSIGVATVSALIGLHQGLTASSLGRRGDVASDWTPAHVGDYLGPALILAIAVFLLVPALALLQRETWRADYARWVDALQRNVLLLLQAGLVLALFWGLLASAAGLFQLVELRFLSELIQQPWFSIPLSTLVFSHAVSIVVRTRRVSDFIYLRSRQLGGWLYPLAALLAICFVSSWAVQGIDRLLGTGRAASLLLWFVLLSLLLLNLASRGGADVGPQRRSMRLLTAMGKAALLPMVVVAGYSLGLRIEQYGLTPERIWALLVVLVVALVVLGYTLDAAGTFRGRRPGRWMPATNVIASAVAVIMIVLLLGGVLDPRRLSVDSQMARLQAGEGSEQALIDFLVRQGGGYGVAALTELARRPAASDSAAQRRAAMALQALGRMQDSQSRQHQVLSALPVFPRGTTLPDALLDRLADEPALAGCSAQISDPNACLLWTFEPDEQGERAFVVLSRELSDPMPFGRLWLADEQGNWAVRGTLGRPESLTGCAAVDDRPAGLFDAVAQNRVEFAAKKLRDLVFGQIRIPTTMWSTDSCR